MVVFADEKKICTTSVVVNVEKSTRPSPHLQLLNIVVSELDKISSTTASVSSIVPVLEVIREADVLSQ